MESFEKKGLWWIPGQETRQVAGILSFTSEDGLRLELLGALRRNIAKPLTSIPTLFGHVDGMGMVTLGRCLLAGTRITVPGTVYESYWPSVAFGGAHILKPAEQTFARVRVAFSRLGEWVRESGISLLLAQQPGSATPIRAEYAHPQEKKVELPSGTLRIRFSGTTAGDLIREFTIKQDTYIDFEPRTALSIDDLFETFVYPIQAFLTFAIARATEITALTVFSDELPLDLGDGRTRRAPIDVYVSTRTAPQEAEKRLLPHDMLFTLQDIELRFKQVLASWFRFYSDIPHCANLLASTYYSPHLHLDRMFLTLAQVSEILHRRRFSRKRLPQDEFERRSRLIGECNPGWLAEWIRGQLRNELSFAQRLDELFREYGECTLPLCSDRQSFVRSAVDTRNYYTHYSSGLKKKAATGNNLYFLGQALSTLASCCLLAEIGISAKGRRSLFLRNQSFLALLHETPNNEATDLFVCKEPVQRNARIRAACKTGRLKQKEIAALVGLHPSSVSRIRRDGEIASA